VKPAKCPFYPDSCTVEFHPNMQHVWRKDIVARIPPRPSSKTSQCVGDGTIYVTNGLASINKASERAQAWNKANRKQYNARQKILMAGKRAKRGG
jgi:hypothetical protein